MLSFFYDQQQYIKYADFAPESSCCKAKQLLKEAYEKRYNNQNTKESPFNESVLNFFKAETIQKLVNKLKQKGYVKVKATNQKH